jgi:hypothetical protein
MSCHKLLVKFLMLVRSSVAGREILHVTCRYKAIIILKTTLRGVEKILAVRLKTFFLASYATIANKILQVERSFVCIRAEPCSYRSSSPQFSNFVA